MHDRFKDISAALTDSLQNAGLDSQIAVVNADILGFSSAERVLTMCPRPGRLRIESGGDEVQEFIYVDESVGRFAKRLVPHRGLKLPSFSGCCSFGCSSPTANGSVRQRKLVLTSRGDGVVFGVVQQLLPFDGQHLLVIVIEKDGTPFPCSPQRLDLRFTQEFLAIAANACQAGYRVGFNGVGAGASVGCFHIQIQGAALPIEDAPEQCIGDLWVAQYPSRPLVFDWRVTSEELYARILALTNQGIPLNILATPARVYLFCRSPNGPAGVAFSECGGRAICADARRYDSITEETAIRDLTASCLDPVAVFG